MDDNDARLYDAIPCGIMHYTGGDEPTTVFANKTACEILGYADFDDLLKRRGPRAFSHVPEHDRRAIDAHMNELFQGRAPSYEFHHRVMRGDGSSGWIRGTAALVDGGDRPLVQAAFNDVTALHDSQYERDRDRYATVLCSAFDEVYEIDVKNDVSRLLSSKPRPDVAGKSLPLSEALDLWEQRVARGRNRESAVAAIRGFASGSETSLTVTYRMKLGTKVIWTESTLMRMGHEGFLCCNQDVTERMRTEEERLSRDIGDIVTRLPVGIGVFAIRDKQAVPLYVSDPVCEMLGYAREEFDLRIADGDPLFDATLLSSSLEAPSASHGAQRQVGAELRLCRKDGVPIIARVRGSLMRARTRGFTLFAAIADITEEARIQNARAWQNERYRILSELTHSISFDYDSQTDTSLLYVDRGNGIEAQTIPHYLGNFESARNGVLHPDSIKDVRALFENLDEKQRATLDYRADYRGDGFRWYRANLFRVEDDAGVWHLIGLMEDIQEERDLIQRAESDQLTGVTNHATTKRLVTEALNDPSLEGRCVCALLDVDDFKSVNDSLGHVKGDELLGLIGSLARSACRSTDIVGRVGGDEFAMLFKGITLEAALSRLDGVRNRVVEFNEDAADPEKRASLSIGVYDVEQGVRTYEEAIAKADKALYYSKRKGKNRISVYRASA